MLAQFKIKLSFSPLICSLQSKRSSENLRVHDFGHVQIEMAFSIKRRGADGSHLKPSKHHDDTEATEDGKILKSKVKLLYNLKYVHLNILPGGESNKEHDLQNTFERPQPQKRRTSNKPSAPLERTSWAKGSHETPSGSASYRASKILVLVMQ